MEYYGGTNMEDDAVTKETMSAIMRDFEINGRSLLRSPDLDSLGNETYSDSEDGQQEAECLDRVLRLLGREDNHKVSERGRNKYVIRKLGFTSYIYLAGSTKGDTKPPY